MKKLFNLSLHTLICKLPTIKMVGWFSRKGDLCLFNQCLVLYFRTLVISLLKRVSFTVKTASWQLHSVLRCCSWNDLYQSLFISIRHMMFKLPWWRKPPCVFPLTEQSRWQSCTATKHKDVNWPPASTLTVSEHGGKLSRPEGGDSPCASVNYSEWFCCVTGTR